MHAPSCFLDQRCFASSMWDQFCRSHLIDYRHWSLKIDRALYVESLENLLVMLKWKRSVVMLPTDPLISDLFFVVRRVTEKKTVACYYFLIV